jgi:hypothetical protein
MALAILVILVLTVVAIAVAYFTQIEDKISGNSRLVKAALYAADTGLRSGENLVGQASNGGTNIKYLIALHGGDNPGGILTLPSGATAVPLHVDIAYGGIQVDGTPIMVLAPTPSGSREVTYYALYVRNNDDDPGGPTVNSDQLINLIAVGMVYAPGADLKKDRPLATKILEEQLMLSAQGNEFGAQKGANQGGTGAGTKG